MHKRLTVLNEGELFVHREKGYIPDGDVGHHARNIQYVTVDTPNGKRMVINFHGLWNGKGKGDCDDRLLQSDNIIRFLKDVSVPYIFTGDFNLLPETESMKKLEQFGLINLIKTHGIMSTRTGLYTKPEKYANYMLVSKDVAVATFAVLPDVVSDHSPLFLECE